MGLFCNTYGVGLWFFYSFAKAKSGKKPYPENVAKVMFLSASWGVLAPLLLALAVFLSFIEVIKIALLQLIKVAAWCAAYLGNENGDGL